MSNVDRVKLTAPFPADAIKTRPGGGGVQLRYIQAFSVIHRLNDACASWDFAVLREWTDGALHKAHVRLTIPEMGSREHIGVQVLNGRPGSEDVDAKGAVSDGLKKAAASFGVGLELSGPDYAEGEIADAPRTQPQRQPNATPNPNTTQQPSQGPRGDITEKQMAYASTLAKGRGMDDIAFSQLVWEDYGKHLSGLDRHEASALIEGLKAPTAERVAGPTLTAPDGDGWTSLWTVARANGLSTKADVEEAIGGLGADPADALMRLRAAVASVVTV